MELEIWQIGNNGMRNANRLQSGLLAYARYPKIGHLGNHRGDARANNKREEIEFTEFLHDENIINADLSRNDGTHARKWRYVAQKMGFIYPPVPRGHDQSELGELNTFTPSGRAFLECVSRAAIYDCFLRAQMVATEPSLYREGAFFSPIRYTAAVLLSLYEATGSSEVDQLCFDTCIQTADPTIPPEEVVKRIIDLSKKEKNASSRRVFKKQYTESLNYSKEKGNFQDYGNTNRRYFILTGLFEKAGRGIRIAEGKESLVRLIAYAEFVSSEQDEFLNKVKVCNIPELPVDNPSVALKYYKDVTILAKQYHILPEYSVAELKGKSAHDINIERYNLEDRIFEAKEDLFAKTQPQKYNEINEYLTLVQSNSGGTSMVDGQEIRVPRDERPAYLEWIAWRAFLAIDHMTNPAAKARHFSVDNEFLPTGTAGGGDCDVLIECGNNIFVIEVTLTNGSRQESAETESVRRHVSDIMRANPDKNVRGVFLANEVASETYNTFKNESYIFDDDEEYEPRILPLSISQFQIIFRYLFRSGEKYATPIEFCKIFDKLDKEKQTFKTWREHIKNEINNLLEIE